ncbi:hypothetical protein WOLCODRAFT_136120 [Wolfiporia cocos MD-104 SS10]|uniref:TEA domain-containing protein n=1 Tax=Wolfiporia cocos (strain MD-104) TaxID=742152 RepID=A0A2H3J8G8_WOLCO|nr:hypothetical protein WOLCODRAFT_136120 [Wolfiporia cocos MD-104 SS10]
MIHYDRNQFGPLLSSRPSPYSLSERMDPSDALKHKSLTPARKHHKLLKDGTEVWSQDVEKVFVDGLHKYWESPWATYSRGRSRWRNQFLVEHLKKHGIERSKKQVASHIQVLRNMWRGQPEFQLVAGGEELFQENGLLASPKAASSNSSPEARPPAVLQPDWRTSWSSSSSAPDFSVLDFPPFDAGAPPPAPQLSPPAHLGTLGADGGFGMAHASSSALGMTHASSSALGSVAPVPARSQSQHRSAVKLEPLSLDPTLFTLPSSSLPDAPEFVYTPPPHHSLPPPPPPNWLCGINFWSDSVPLVNLNVEQLAAQTAGADASFRVLLRLRISFPAMVYAPQQFAGVQGAVSFAAPWARAARCHTKVWAGRTCIAHMAEDLHTQPGGGAPMVVASLPESVLGRCRYLDAGTSPPRLRRMASLTTCAAPAAQTLSQQIVVDGEVLAVLLYTLEHTAAAGGPPGVSLLGFHRYPWRVPPHASPPVSPALPPLFPHAGGYAATATPQTPLFTRPPSSGDDVSLAGALDFSHTTAMTGGSPVSGPLARQF